MDKPTVVIDNGSDTLKVGYSGEDEPRACFPTVVKKLASPDEDISIYLDGDIQNKDDINCILSHPIEYGTINCWQDMKYLWNYCYSSKLAVNSEDYRILMTERPNNAKPNREKMIHIMFEEFKVPQFYVAPQVVLALFSVGKTTGIVLDVGLNITHAVPVYEGIMLPEGIGQVDFGGADITKKVQDLLEENGLSHKDESILRDIKEKCCYIRFQEDEADNGDRKYTLPDGEVINISESVAKSPEALFYPFNSHYSGIHDMIHKAIINCDVNLRREFYSSIVLSGGSTSFKGINKRLKNEFLNCVCDVNLTVFPFGERKFQAWIGGSILSSLDSFEPMMINKDEYDEHGPSIVHRKCNMQKGSDSLC